ncbi:translesion error-prone DNA polymerase V autoproteolytic subunit [Chitinophaga varians]|uniref:Translesion error-prone DNA polymerase V autoproteolytic subunit n=1 Tax=Chitinophaga varians TaxID=2202339 RepID=A0A847RJB7_9BACT|nr:translesion error-prone DNA polymerase V autoproteolytic subunit [Chitinophaga varians]NLR65970.1 translesion error-prone DNA polymerase V autoproteolytic subunit [Chitinophaga varians]
MEAMKWSEPDMTLPYFDTSIAAGLPSPAFDSEQERIDLSRIIPTDARNAFIVRVKGDSMSEAHIPDGSLAVVDRSIRPSTGDIIVGTLNGEFTIKRLVKAGRNWVLHPDNPFHKPVMITDDADFQVWGIVTAVIVDMRK